MSTTGRPAAFFDLDKTIIAKSSVMAFGRPFYQGGLINRRALLKSTYAQFVYLVGGADHDQIERMRAYLSQLCKGWDVEQVKAIVAETLHDLIDPLIYDEAAALIEEHHAAGRVVFFDQGSGLVVDQRVNQVVQGFGDDRLHLLDVPALAQLRQVGPHPLDLIMVGATDEIDELGVGALEQRAPVDEAALVERAAKSHDARLGDDRLVEVEEGGLAVAAHDPTISGRRSPAWPETQCGPFRTFARPKNVPLERFPRSPSGVTFIPTRLYPPRAGSVVDGPRYPPGGGCSF